MDNELIDMYEAYRHAEQEGEHEDCSTCSLCGDALTDEDKSYTLCNVCAPIISGVID